MFASRKRLSVALGALVVAAAGATLPRLSVIDPLPAAQASGSAASAVEVDVATVVHRPITEWQGYSGRLEAVDKVDVRPQVAGTVTAVHVKDGGLVKQGDPLFTIDPRPYQAVVDQAAARLAAAETRAAYAATEAERAERLLGSEAIARRDYDSRQNARREAAADLQAARAALEAARIDLAHTEIAAPVAGRVSRAELTVGNVVAAGANAPVLTTLVSVSPIYAAFEMDEQSYLRTLRRQPGAQVPVSLGLADEDGYSRDGVIVSVDNHLDATSGTIRVRARFDNADGTLVPGLFARLRVGGSQPHPAILVSDAAIGTDQAKKYVLVVDETDRVQYREVTPGGLSDGLRVVSAGLRPDERVVVEGGQRVRPNDSVKVHAVPMAVMAARQGE